MANYSGSNSVDDVMGYGTASPGTPLADRWSSGAGNDTFVYAPSSAGGADRFSGGLGKDTIEFRLTTAEWNNAVIRGLLQGFKANVDSRVSLSASGTLVAGSGFSPLVFGSGKSLTVLEVENVRVFANDVLVLGTAAPSRTGQVKEAGVDGSYAALAGTPQATGVMPALDSSGNGIDAGASWAITGLPSTSYGAFSITPSGQWTYQLDNNNPATQGLQEGQTVTQVFTVAATVGTSAAFSSVTITIAGTNDKAEVKLEGGDFSISERGGGANTEQGPDGDGASGLLTLTNVDGAPPPTVPANQPFSATTNLPGIYGDWLLTRGTTADSKTTAVWSYTLRNDSAQVQALTGQQVVFDVIQLPASAFDGATETITIRVTGSDDWAVISAGAPDLLVSEAGGIQNSQPGDTVAVAPSPKPTPIPPGP